MQLFLLFPFLLALFCTNPNEQTPAGNPFVGTYRSHHLEPFSASDVIIDDLSKEFTAEITFYANYTFVKTTNGITVNGKYTLEKKKISFYFCSKQETCDADFFIRAPLMGSDLFPKQEHCDLKYPEAMKILTKKGVEGVSDVYACYVKVE